MWEVWMLNKQRKLSKFLKAYYDENDAIEFIQDKPETGKLKYYILYKEV